MTTVPRREFIRIASAAVVASRSFWPLAARAQQPKKVPRIGYLSAGSPPPNRAFWQGMREFGYVESQNILVDYRWAEGKPERLPELTADLIRLKVEVVFALARRRPSPRRAPLQQLQSSSIRMPILLRLDLPPASRDPAGISPA